MMTYALLEGAGREERMTGRFESSATEQFPDNPFFNIHTTVLVEICHVCITSRGS